jgi:hypothetical protein
MCVCEFLLEERGRGEDMEVGHFYFQWSKIIFAPPKKKIKPPPKKKYKKSRPLSSS